VYLKGEMKKERGSPPHEPPLAWSLSDEEGPFDLIALCLYSRFVWLCFVQRKSGERVVVEEFVSLCMWA